MWVTKKFPLKSKNYDLDVMPLCTNSKELHNRLQEASVHWLLVSEQSGLQVGHRAAVAFAQGHVLFTGGGGLHAPRCSLSGRGVGLGLRRR